MLNNSFTQSCVINVYPNPRSVLYKNNGIFISPNPQDQGFFPNQRFQDFLEQNPDYSKSAKEAFISFLKNSWRNPRFQGFIKHFSTFAIHDQLGSLQEKENLDSIDIPYYVMYKVSPQHAPIFLRCVGGIYDLSNNSRVGVFGYGPMQFEREDKRVMGPIRDRNLIPRGTSVNSYIGRMENDKLYGLVAMPIYTLPSFPTQ